MKFFVPFAEDETQAERVYAAIAEFNNVAVTSKRIYALTWHHAGQEMATHVGDTLPAYYRAGADPVLAILERPGLYLVCSANRGGIRNEPVLVGTTGAFPTYFTGE